MKAHADLVVDGAPDTPGPSEERIMRSLLKMGLEGARRLPFSRPPYTPLMKDAENIVNDMVADAEAAWQAKAPERLRQGQNATCPTPLMPEQTSGRLLDTDS